MEGVDPSQILTWQGYFAVRGLCIIPSQSEHFDCYLLPGYWRCILSSANGCGPTCSEARAPSAWPPNLEVDPQDAALACTDGRTQQAVRLVTCSALIIGRYAALWPSQSCNRIHGFNLPLAPVVPLSKSLPHQLCPLLPFPQPQSSHHHHQSHVRIFEIRPQLVLFMISLSV